MLIKLLGVAIDVLGADAVRAFVPDLVGYLAGAPHEGSMRLAGQRIRAVARHVIG